MKLATGSSKLLSTLLWLGAIGFGIFALREPVAAAHLVTAAFQKAVAFFSNLG
ncbi:hypothetical protein AB0K48_05110 [Nonomuraea sp. NPDC055795]